MRSLLLAAAIIVMNGCLPATQGQESGRQFSSPEAQELLPGEPVPVSVQGAWQVFYLPDEWIRSYWKGADNARLYVALAPPHSEDLQGDYAPCDPPGRIVLGIAGNTSREHLAACLAYCARGDSPDHMYRDLWGSLSHLSGITLQILDDGSIDIIEHYRKKAFVPPEVYEAPMVVDKLALEDEVRIRHHTIAPSEFAFTGEVAGSCISMDEAARE